VIPAANPVARPGSSRLAGRRLASNVHIKRHARSLDTNRYRLNLSVNHLIAFLSLFIASPCSGRHVRCKRTCAAPR
jgi:hypothetical protein